MQKYLSTLSNTDFTSFKKQLSEYKQQIDTELAVIADQLVTGTAEQFGELPKEVVQAYVNVLSSGGKRIRGSLAMASYAMFGGTDKKLITQAACALEMLNTYILIADDIQDRSETRRGGKTAHAQLRDYHINQHLKGDSTHFGEALAINSFLVAQHYAANIITSLSAPSDVRIKALENINKCFIVTAHGQTMDLFVEVNGSTSIADVDNILEWKTAYYTFINPLQLGAILAGADDARVKKLAEYGLHAGRSFQLTDDIIGTFGDEAKTGKSPLDDIKEGKRTLLVVHSLAKASTSDAYFLESCLGNQALTMHEFEQCQKIITHTGALKLTQDEATASAAQACAAIADQATHDAASKQFLIDLANYLLVRDA
jgi:geranylgeranyl diphosphate synthase type I